MNGYNRHQNGINRRSEREHSSTEREIAQEKAVSLGKAGRRLDQALRQLAEHGSSQGTDPPQREALVEEAGEALFFYLVQREACGLYDSAEVLRELNVPFEVQRRMGLRRRKKDG